jgi:voltage-gated potassium channel
MRRRIYEILHNPHPDDHLGRFISIALLLLIAANVAASILETDAELARSAPAFFEWFERISIVVFSVEYVLRLWSCTADPRFAGAVRGRLLMAITPMALIDLVAIAPSYFELLLPGMFDLRFLRALRLLRLFRLLRYSRIAEAFATMVRVLQSKRVELAVSLAIVIVVMLLAAGAVYVTERDEPGTQFTSIPHAMWWAVVTITTIGYGDMTPTTPLGKVIGGLVAFIGICAVALPVGIVSSGFIEELNRKKQQTAAPTAARACPHCGGVLDD